MDVVVYVASAFSKNGKGGNKAGVVFDEGKLSRVQKMKIAKELGYAETAFISDSVTADFKLEYFTPKEEVDLCGHATIASFKILTHLNKLAKNSYTIETKKAILSIDLDQETIFMEQNKPEFFEEVDKEEFNQCFDSEKIVSDYQVQIVSTGLRDILIPITSEEELHQLTLDFEKIKAVSNEKNVIGMHLYAMNQERFICRNFAPLYDIDEEAATGTSNGALACYLYSKLGIKKDLYTFEQGYALESPSEVFVKLKVDSEDAIEQVYVGGKSYFCEMKKLNI
ncbi:PhzF family phenazine biosynthesis isomerase [Vagococcus fluvialis]|uniref:PhzF family phenazine biosynthesis isomerase n=1 Tax=Vagococcus fluvialis TaxID=2738 RepID=UPI001432FB9D|nr:PhzF family phenazine biosynthesis protein [Vagococcus fluvialis]NKD51539.1 PhzF family phenazine biosynthesis protein [Vagococcus fluvialis]